MHGSVHGMFMAIVMVACIVLQVESGRYHVYVGNACPWCHRVLLVLALTGVCPGVETQALNCAAQVMFYSPCMLMLKPGTTGLRKELGLMQQNRFSSAFGLIKVQYAALPVLASH
jgi:hypothetical protein